MELRTSFGVLNDKARESVKSAQHNLLLVTNQVTSGKQADNYTDLLETTPLEPLFNAKDLQANYQHKIQGNSLLLRKLSAMEGAVRNLTEKIIPESIVLCMRAQDPATSGTFDSTALTKNQLSSIKNALEATFNNQKLFAGSHTQTTQTLGDIINVSNILGGQATANYYHGNDYLATEYISENQKLSYGVTADNTAFAKLIAAHHYLLAGDYNNAMSNLTAAKVECGNIVSVLGNNSKLVTTQISADEQSNMQLTESISNMEDVDVMEALTHLYNLQTQVKASFMLTTKLNELSIVNYMK